MATATRHIEVWYDETSDAEKPVYCVSMCEEDGDEIRCLSTHDELIEAIDAARKHGKPMFFRAANGETDPLS